MCGRYYVDDETVRAIEKIVRELDQRLLKRGEICPGQKAAVIAREDENTAVRQMEWGFPAPQSNRVIVNARSETALEKRMFSKSLIEHRCIIPAAWFYEWDRDKNKVAFKPQQGPGLFLAGFFQYFQKVPRFVILTAPANVCVSAVHERMPLILERSECEAWLGNTQEFEILLKKQPDPPLNPDGFIQQNLFGI